MISNPESFFDSDFFRVSGSTTMFPDDFVTRDATGNILTVFGVPVIKKK